MGSLNKECCAFSPRSDGNVKRRFPLGVLFLGLCLVGTGQIGSSSVPADIQAEAPPPPTFRDSQPYFAPEPMEDRLSPPPTPQSALPLEKANRPSPQTADSPEQDGGGSTLIYVIFIVIAYYVYRRMFHQTHDKKCYLCKSKFKRGRDKYVWELRDGNTVFVCSMCNRCQICELHFGEKGKIQEWQFEDERKVICLPCHKKLEAKVRSEKFDEWFESKFGSNTDRSTNPKETRERISSAVKREVWRRDKGKCVICGVNENLEYDHVIPVSKGGANTVRNLQLLCEGCNRSKSARIQ